MTKQYQVFTRIVLFTVISTLPLVTMARSGCCSHHGGVCGCGCCDGTSLSATCAPYYPCTRSTVIYSNPPMSNSYQFNRNLQFGNYGDDVSQLQSVLRAQGTDIYPEGLITSYFGSLTEKAVERFQVKYGIVNIGETGYGLVGPRTRAKLNSF